MIERTISMIKNMPEETIRGLRQRLNLAGKNLVLVALEPLEKDFGYLDGGIPFLGYNEFSVLKYFFEKMDYRSSRILINPHPRHDVGTIRDFISDFTITL